MHHAHLPPLMDRTQHCIPFVLSESMMEPFLCRIHEISVLVSTVVFSQNREMQAVRIIHLANCMVEPNSWVVRSMILHFLRKGTCLNGVCPEVAQLHSPLAV